MSDSCLFQRLACGRKSSGATFSIAYRIGFVDPGAWDAVAEEGGFFLSRAYLEALESAPPEGLESRYAIVHAGSEPIAALACQLLDVDADRILGEPPAGRGLREKALRRFRSRLLVCGNLLSWGPHAVSFAPGVDRAGAFPVTKPWF